MPRRSPRGMGHTAPFRSAVWHEVPADKGVTGRHPQHTRADVPDEHARLGGVESIRDVSTLSAGSPDDVALRIVIASVAREVRRGRLALEMRDDSKAERANGDRASDVRRRAHPTTLRGAVGASNASVSPGLPDFVIVCSRYPSRIATTVVAPGTTRIAGTSGNWPAASTFTGRRLPLACQSREWSRDGSGPIRWWTGGLTGSARSRGRWKGGSQ